MEHEPLYCNRPPNWFVTLVVSKNQKKVDGEFDFLSNYNAKFVGCKSESEQPIVNEQ